MTSSYYYAYLAAFGDDGGEGDPGFDAFEIMFFTDMVLTFFVDYYPDESKKKPERRLKFIALRYLKGTFIFELIPLLPF